MNPLKRTAVITGASAGIGEATARRLAQNGYNLAICARRIEKLQSLAESCRESGSDIYFEKVDVCSSEDRIRFTKNVFERFESVDVLVNNAGLAMGMDTYLESKSEDIQQMFETNVFSVYEMTKLFLPEMIERKSGHLVFIGSIAAHQPYEKGSAYCASKHAQRAMIESLRQEITEHPIRVTTIDPGMVNTEFSTVRLRGDRKRADSLYEGIIPLVGDDIAECILWAISRPDHVNISEITVLPVHQADARKIHRKK